ncbi:AI-2E family transporter [Tateyamaria sp.]|uniref:AI-2E family transporter n=1 Tax=Tateyamaria sp. TaxID=1929288 RepID=UPI00329F7A9B
MTTENITTKDSKITSVVPTWFLTIVSLPIIIGMLWFGRDFLIPISLATLLFILNIALIERLNSAKILGQDIPRWAAYIGVTAGLFILLVGFGYVLSNQAAAVADAGPRYTERLGALETQFDAFVGAERAAAIEKSIMSIDIESWLTGFAASTAGVIGNIGLILLYVAFMLGERGAFAKKLPRLCATPESARQVENILRSISTGVRQYMWINATTSAMSGTLAFIVMTVLGVDFALPLALLVFLLNFIPSIGSFLAVLFPTTVALLQFESIVPALTVVAVYGGGDAIIGNIVQPRLQGKSLNLSTFVVMVALTFWSLMWGGIGAFIAVPLTVVIMIVCSEIPGLQPFARLLSSDGVLPKEQVDDVDDDPRFAAKPSSRKSDETATALKQPHSETEEELALMKQELLERKKARQRQSEPTSGANPKPDTR